jgi:GAF domain-containing protein
MREPDAVTVPSVTSEQSGDRDRTAGGAGEGRSGEGHSRVRRGRELASLYATARAITALDEVDTVLASIVRHAHELLGADVTYLSVYDETDGHLRLRGVEGAVSATFAHAHVPPDIGVAGRILATGAPFWVSDYLGDTTLKRDPGFDAAAAGEGLAAMLGVPLRDKAGVFGALFVAERFSRSFAVEEVALLSAFADHAAIAIVNARLYDESRRALAEVRQAYETMERSAQVHEALTRVVLHGGGAAEVAELLVEELGGRVTVVDRQGEPAVVRQDPQGAPPLESDRMRQAILDSQVNGRSVIVEPEAAPGTGPQPGQDAVRVTGLEAGAGLGPSTWHCVTAVVAGDSSLGALVLSQPTEPSISARQTVERAAQILALLTLKQDAVVEAEERVRGELVAELILASRPYSDELLARAEARGLAPLGLSAVLVAECPSIRAAELGRRLDPLARERGGIAGDFEGSALMRVSADDADAVAREVHATLQVALRSPVLVVAAPVAEAAVGFRESLTVAQRCGRVLRALGVEDRGTSTTRWGMYSLVFDPDRSGELQDFISDRLGPLIEYDGRRRTDLVATVDRYFDCGRMLTRTADELHVHMNTLVKRLDRVDVVLGEEWREQPRALEIEVAARLYRLSREVV